MSKYAQFPRRVVTEATVTRGAALRAADKWFGLVRHRGLTELPTSDIAHPCDDERVWQILVGLHSHVTGQSYGDAERKLREDFRRYMALLPAAVEHGQSAALTEAPVMALAYLLMNECAWEADDVLELLRQRG